jgi:hypothetical protein
MPDGKLPQVTRFYRISPIGIIYLTLIAAGSLGIRLGIGDIKFRTGGVGESGFVGIGYIAMTYIGLHTRAGEKQTGERYQRQHACPGSEMPLHMRHEGITFVPNSQKISTPVWPS